jgi:hypothetical protein
MIHTGICVETYQQLESKIILQLVEWVQQYWLQCTEGKKILDIQGKQMGRNWLAGSIRFKASAFEQFAAHVTFSSPSFATSQSQNNDSEWQVSYCW